MKIKNRLLALVLALASVLSPVAYAQRGGHRGGHSGSHASRRAVPRNTAPRPYYGGGRHTTPHGGQYAGSVNPHHKGGHYVNPKTHNRYGVHKAR